jgi:hypothetical protein
LSATLKEHQKMKRLTAITLCLIQAACSHGTTAAVAVATLGIAGAGLIAYCGAGGSGCSPALLAYGSLITTEATRDAAVLESGQTTSAELTQIVNNLQVDISQGNALANLTPSQRQEVLAIVTAASSVITLVKALIPKTPVAAVNLPALSAADSQKIAAMRTSVAAVKK